ncbi:transmembrane protein 198-like [Montipora capricornis]|uniref:transmembrane protein 198-like n=1 Tax=Montipora capricornis TaxID=246305 RepID=UPI0035F16D85
MRLSFFLTLLLIVVATCISSIHGQNSTVAPTEVNVSSEANLVTAVSEILPNQTVTMSTGNASERTTVIVPGVKKGQCYDFKVFIMNNKLNIPYTITCCITVLCGFYLVVFGYRFFKCSLFLLGFLFGTSVTYVICSIHADLPTWGLMAVAVAVGIFCGLLTMFVTYCGLFLGGFSLGFFIGIAIFFVIETFYHVTIRWIPFGVLLGLSLIFALLTLRWQKGFFIVATSLLGAAMITAGVDYFVEEFVLINYAWQRIMADNQKVECWVTWIVLGLWLVMFVLGNVVQFCKTGKTFTHVKRKDSLPLQGEDKAMKRYRSLNMNGDVVAKSFYNKDEDEGRPTEV